ncbi:hypothetical protein JCM15519_15700 [Fundidesulfovibrio butyratiphilus]
MSWLMSFPISDTLLLSVVDEKELVDDVPFEEPRFELIASIPYIDDRGS